jgi:exodeoxyribonuclease V gamma subunit
VCLLGLDDGVFPRGGSIDGDDVLSRLPRVGERDVRSEDRQLFLDAIMSAGERLVITYTGFNESTGQPRPPSVPLREFLDVAGRTAGHDIVRQHRAQAFHTDYLVPGRIHEREPFSFDPDAAAAARAAAGPRTRPPLLAELDADAPPVGDVELGDLVDVLTSPVRAFLRRRLQIDLPREEEQVTDSLPVELGGLATWQVGDRLLREILGGRSAAEACEAEWRRGTMPPGLYGWRRTNAIALATGPLAELFEASTQGMAPKARDLAVDLGGGRRLIGTVAGIHGERLVRVGYSRLRAKQRLEVWISLVALSAAHPGSWMARAIGRAEEGDAPARATYSSVDDPAPILADLVALHDLALTRVLPLCADTGRLYATTASSGSPPWMRERDLQDACRKEHRATELVTAWGRRPSWQDLTAAPATDGGEHLFGELALRLWRPALERELE